MTEPTPARPKAHAMTPARHRGERDYCIRCKADWPCVGARLAAAEAENARLRAAVELTAALGWVSGRPDVNAAIVTARAALAGGALPAEPERMASNMHAGDGRHVGEHDRIGECRYVGCVAAGGAAELHPAERDALPGAGRPSLEQFPPGVTPSERAAYVLDRIIAVDDGWGDLANADCDLLRDAIRIAADRLRGGPTGGALPAEPEPEPGEVVDSDGVRWRKRTVPDKYGFVVIEPAPRPTTEEPT